MFLKSEATYVPMSSVSRIEKVRGIHLSQEYELAKFTRDVENPHE